MKRPSKLFFYFRVVTARHPKLFGSAIVNWFIDREERWLNELARNID